MDTVPGILALRHAIGTGELAPDDVIRSSWDRARQSQPVIEAFAFLPEEAPAVGHGPLAGIPVAIKDLIDTADMPTAYGAAVFKRHRPTADAAIVAQLRACGASVIGKTVTTEFAYQQPGPTRNPCNLAHTPGGSSSGSASAVAAGACDFALGTDSGGSVRVPASFCGLYGIRPTHGRIDFAGITVQAPNADTCGWFARDARVFARVGEVLFGQAVPDRLPGTLLVAADALGFADEPVQRALAPMIDRLASLIGGRREVTMAPQGLSVWQRAQRVLQSSEAWATFAPWLDAHNPRLAFSVARSLIQGSMMTDQERSAATLMRIEARARLAKLLAPSTILCLPTTPFPAPLKGQPTRVLNPLRERIGCLTSHGGLTGVPQVNLPGATVDGAPVGLSIIGGRGADLDLLRVAVAMEG